MIHPSRKEAENILIRIMKNTLVNEEDFLYIENIIKNSIHPLPMKGISYCYDKMERRKMNKEDRNDFETLMYFWGP